VRQRIVLAEDAAKIAPGEEDRARTPNAGERRLFPEVAEKTGDSGEAPGLAIAGLSACPVNPAPAGADVAMMQTRDKIIRDFLQRAAFEKRQIRRGHAAASGTNLKFKI
jgi:hypothetical protein